MRGDNLAGCLTPREAKRNDLLNHRVRGNDSRRLFGRECKREPSSNQHKANRRSGQRVGNIENATRGLLPKIVNIDGLVDRRVLPRKFGKRRFEEGLGKGDGPRASRKNGAKRLDGPGATAQDLQPARCIVHLQTEHEVD